MFEPENEPSLTPERKTYHPGGDCHCGTGFIYRRTYGEYEYCLRCEKLRPFKVGTNNRAPATNGGATIEEIAVGYLRAFLTPGERKKIRRWRRNDPTGFIVGIHHDEGRRIRNALRSVGLTEPAFGVKNLDDIYIGLLLKAVAI